MAATIDDLFTSQLRLMADVLGTNDAANLRILRLYAETYERLSVRWLAILEDIEKGRGDALNPPQSFDVLLQQQARIRTLRQQTAAQIARFGREAEGLVTAEQREAVEVGRIHAERMMAEALSVTAPGFEASFAQLPASALRELVGRFDNGEPLRALFDVLGTDAAAQAERVLFQAVATGIGPRLAARQLRTALGVPLTRAMTISRTTMLDSYRTSNLESFRANRDLVRGWRWNASLEPRTCASCISLHGTTHPLDEPFREHVAGRCVPIPITMTWAELGFSNIREPKPPRPGIEWFDAQSESTKLRVLGPTKLALFKDGKLDLPDLVYESFSPRWGSSFREGSIAYALSVHGQQKPWLRYDLD